MKAAKENIKCVICGCEDTTNLHMHFYHYVKCSYCKHIHNQFDKQGIKKNLIKFNNKRRNQNNWILQNTFTDLYIIYQREKTREKIKHIVPILKLGSSVLEIETELGLFVGHLNNKFNAIGIDDNKEYENHWENKSSFQRTSIEKYITKKFDFIIINNLEYSYCPYSVIIESLLRLREKGKIIGIVPVNNNPREKYMARSHEFSSNSIEHFAKTCCLNSYIKKIDNKAIFTLIT